MSAYDDFFNAIKGCSSAAQKDFEKIWSLLDFSDKDYSIEILFDLLPGLVERYGNAAAIAAANMYDIIANEAGVRISSAELSPTQEAKMLDSVNYAKTLIENGNYDIAKRVLATAIDYYTKKPARDTVYNNAKRDGARYARVPRGATTCEFCLMLASRGFIYHTEEDAGGDGNKYHTHCDCLPVASFDKNPVVDGYNPDYYYKLYLEMRDKDKWNMAYKANHGK